MEKLTFTIGRDKVVAKPIGTLLIGSRGRLDLSGVRKTLRIVCLEEGGRAMRITIAGGGEGLRDGGRCRMINRAAADARLRARKMDAQ